MSPFKLYKQILLIGTQRIGFSLIFFISNHLQLDAGTDAHDPNVILIDDGQLDVRFDTGKGCVDSELGVDAAELSFLNGTTAGHSLASIHNFGGQLQGKFNNRQVREQ